MPVFTSATPAPAWCEMRHFEVLKLAPGQTHHFEGISPKEKLIIAEGQCRIAVAGQITTVGKGAILDLTTSETHFEVTEVLAPATLVRMGGHWGDVTGGSGLFSVVKADSPQDRGDAVSYPKETNFDSHYHDCDEYWIVLEGRGVAVSEGKPYTVGAGDCVATGMGHHHDFPQVCAPVKAVYFETTLEGQKRLGHLWNHTHGPAEPKRDRI